MKSFTRSWKGIVLGGAAAVALVIAAGNLSPAMAQDDSQNQPEVVVGTFKHQKLIKPYQQNLRQRMQKIQRNLQGQAQGQNKQQRRQTMMQARQMMQQEQQKMRQRYQGDLDNVMPKVAKAADVSLIVPAITYKADRVETKDVTQQVRKQLKKLAPKTQSAAPQGMMPTPGQGRAPKPDARQGKAPKRSKGQGKAQRQDKAKGQGKSQ